MDGTKRPTGPLHFLDFAISVWREGPCLQVLAHSTPAGGMRQPVTVKLVDFKADDYRIPQGAPLSHGARVGRELARFLFPDSVWALFCRSLGIVAPRPELGLRLRLCFDDDLIDLPWEFLYRPDVDAAAALSGFLLMDARLSLVREAPSRFEAMLPSERTHRGIFVGAFVNDGADERGVADEFKNFVAALEPVKALMSLQFARADASAQVEALLDEGCEVFHYSGHVQIDLAAGSETLVRLGRSAESSMTDATPPAGSWASSDELAVRLTQAGAQLAVFNACNSGFWPFVRPFMRAGIPAVVGVQGSVKPLPARTFSGNLYQSLAVGLSLDEGLINARLSVVDPSSSSDQCDWGRFMAYMPTKAAVLFPRQPGREVRRCQRDVQAQHSQVIRDVAAFTKAFDGAELSRMLSDIAQRSVLILGRFTADRKGVLDAIKTALASPGRDYVPLLFDFEKPNDRDLIESIIRFAAVSRFVVADLSAPKSIPAELQAIVPQFPSLPVIPIMALSEREYPVADNILRRSSVLRPIVHYRDLAHLMAIFDSDVLGPAEALYTLLNPSPGRGSNTSGPSQPS